MTAPNPFDEVIERIRVAGYHNQRLEDHSDLVSKGIFRDLLARCPSIASDFELGTIRAWENVKSPGGTRRRLIDLFVGQPSGADQPSLDGVRFVVENKSVMTAHRNKTNRLDDLDKVLSAIHGARPEAVLVATVLVGTASRYLNVCDRITPYFEDKPGEFESTVLPRLSSGDETLWKDFRYAISRNQPDHPKKTVEAFRQLPTRAPGRTHVMGFDFVMIVPVFVDNVNPPRLCRDNPFGIDIDGDYAQMLSTICRAYQARWHL